MSKERVYSRKAFIRLALGFAGGIAVYEIGKTLPFFESLPEFSEREIKQFEGIDVALVFNPGGWGCTSLEEDRNWQEILENIKKGLENRGYKTTILEEMRRKGPFFPISTSSERTTKKIQQLTESFPKLKIILTGRSFGASYIENVLRALPENNQILAIEAIRPFENRNPSVAPERTLVIENHKSDPLQKGNIGEILRAYFPPAVFIGEGGDFGIGKLRIDFQLPEHDSCCSWDLQMAEAVKGFLDIHFPSRK